MKLILALIFALIVGIVIGQGAGAYYMRNRLEPNILAWKHRYQRLAKPKQPRTKSKHPLKVNTADPYWLQNLKYKLRQFLDDPTEYNENQLIKAAKITVKVAQTKH